MSCFQLGWNQWEEDDECSPMLTWVCWPCKKATLLCSMLLNKRSHTEHCLIMCSLTLILKSNRGHFQGLWLVRWPKFSTLIGWKSLGRHFYHKAVADLIGVKMIWQDKDLFRYQHLVPWLHVIFPVCDWSLVINWSLFFAKTGFRCSYISAYHIITTWHMSYVTTFQIMS